MGIVSTTKALNKKQIFLYIVIFITKYFHRTYYISRL